MLVIIVDSHSKWIEASDMENATSAATLCYLGQVFVQFETVVLDNGTQFVPEEFKEFCQLNGICHVQTAPYHPSSLDLLNGLLRL